MSGAGDSNWYVSSAGWTEDDTRLFRITFKGGLVGYIASPHLNSAMDVLSFVTQVEVWVGWPEAEESIEDYAKRIENHE